MIRLKVSYQDPVEKDKLISSIKKDFRIMNGIKEYPGQGKSPHRRFYMDLSKK